MRVLVIGACLLASGCASAPESFPMPDGRTGYVVSCDGKWTSWAACFEAAAKTCGGKYEIVKQAEDTGLVANAYVAAPKALRSLQYACPA